MSIDILSIIVITAIIQSIFGTGVLLFGTPLLLMMGYDFQFILVLLLPISVVINLFQIKNSLGIIDMKFYRKLIVFTLPLIIFIIMYISISGKLLNIFIGLFLLVISLKDSLQFVNKLLYMFFKYETLCLILMGILHGLTNLGGALLSGLVFTKKLSKKSKRATIAISYLSMALTQIITLLFIEKEVFTFISLNIFLWVLGLAIYLIVNKYFFQKINETRYTMYSNYFLFLIGFALIIKSFII